IPREGLGVVLLDAKSKVVELTHLEFSGRVSLRGRLLEPADRFSRIRCAIVKERAEQKLCDAIARSGLRGGGCQSWRHILVRLRLERRCADEPDKGGADGEQ